MLVIWVLLRGRRLAEEPILLPLGTSTCYGCETYYWWTATLIDLRVLEHRSFIGSIEGRSPWKESLLSSCLLWCLLWLTFLFKPSSSVLYRRKVVVVLVRCLSSSTSLRTSKSSSISFVRLLCSSMAFTLIRNIWVRSASFLKPVCVVSNWSGSK